MVARVVRGRRVGKRLLDPRPCSGSRGGLQPNARAFEQVWFAVAVDVAKAHAVRPASAPEGKNVLPSDGMVRPRRGGVAPIALVVPLGLARGAGLASAKILGLSIAIDVGEPMMLQPDVAMNQVRRPHRFTRKRRPGVLVPITRSMALALRFRPHVRAALPRP